MHKSWGNAIEFDEAAERMGVDVMRWMYASGQAGRQHPVRLARGGRGAPRAARAVERVRVLRHVRPPRRLDAGGGRAGRRRPPAARPLDPLALGRGRGAVEARLRDFDAEAATRVLAAAHRRPVHLVPPPLAAAACRGATGADRDAAFATLHEALVALARTVAPILPFLSDAIYGNLVAAVDPAAPDTVHLTRVAGRRARPAARRAARGGDGGGPPGRGPRRGRCAARPGSRSASRWRACGWPCPAASSRSWTRCWSWFAPRPTSRRSSASATSRSSSTAASRCCCRGSAGGWAPGSRRSWPRRARAASRSTPDGTVTIDGETLAADEVEIQATPRPGTAVAHDDGLVAVIDTTLTPELRAEGDARELQRAVQDLRKEAELDLDDRIVLWVDGLGSGGRSRTWRPSARRHARGRDPPRGAAGGHARSSRSASRAARPGSRSAAPTRRTDA